MPTRMRSRNDTAAAWTASNPILARGELGLEGDTNLFKFGDGIRAWSALPYAGGTGGTGPIPTDVLRNTTPGVVLFQADGTLVGTAAFVMPGFYLRTSTGWTFPPWLQQQSLERFSITTFPYTLIRADAEIGMIFLSPAADAQVNLPSGVTDTPMLPGGRRSFLDIAFYLAGAVTVTFVAGSGVTLLVPGATDPSPTYQVTGPRRTVLMQAQSTSYRVLD